MGSSSKQFIDAMVVVERIKQGIRSGRIFALVEKGFEGW
jgi:hypothetical protein